MNALINQNVITIFENIKRDAMSQPDAPWVLGKFCKIMDECSYCEGVTCEACPFNNIWGMKEAAEGDFSGDGSEDTL